MGGEVKRESRGKNMVMREETGERGKEKGGEKKESREKCVMMKREKKGKERRENRENVG